MSFLGTEEPIVTDNNHVISQWFQKKYGFSILKYKKFAPCVYNKNTKTFVQKWDTENNFRVLKNYSKKLEDSFSLIETKSAPILTNVINSLPHIKINPALQFPDFNKPIKYSFRKPNFNNLEINTVADFYISLIQRYIAKESIPTEPSSIINIMKPSLKKTEVEMPFNNLSNVKTKIQNEIQNNPLRIVRDLGDEWDTHGVFLKNSKENLINELQNNYLICDLNLPYFFLGDNAFSLHLNESQYSEESYVKLLIMPLSCYSIFIHNSYFYNMNLNGIQMLNEMDKILQSYAKAIFTNSENLMFCCPEVMHYWLKKLNNKN